MIPREAGKEDETDVGDSHSDHHGVTEIHGLVLEEMGCSPSDFFFSGYMILSPWKATGQKFKTCRK